MAHPPSVASRIYDLLEIVEAQSEGWYTRIDPNPDSGSPVSEAIMDRIIHNAYEALVEGHISMRERYGLKSSLSKGGEDGALLPLQSLGFSLRAENGFDDSA